MKILIIISTFLISLNVFSEVCTIKFGSLKSGHNPRQYESGTKVCCDSNDTSSQADPNDFACYLGTTKLATKNTFFNIPLSCPKEELVKKPLPFRFQLFSLPSQISTESAKRLMIKNLELINPFESDLIVNYFGSDKCQIPQEKHADKKYCTINSCTEIEGSTKIEHNTIYLIDGPANIRNRPNGETIASWPNAIPVLAHKKKDSWVLISNIDQRYGWTHQKNLKEVPQGKILLDADSIIAKGVPETIIQWSESDLDEIIINLNNILKSNNKDTIAKALSTFCPKDFTEAEKDGLFEEEIIHGMGGESRREKLAKLCRVVSDTSSPIKKVKLKSNTCNCTTASMGEIGSVIIRNGSFPPTSKMGDFKCLMYKYHIMCDVMEGCGEGCAPGIIACPKKCLDFE